MSTINCAFTNRADRAVSATAARQATRWASTIGQFIAWLFIACGAALIFSVNIPFFDSGFINGLWLAFIGWFLNNAAIQSYQPVVITDERAFPVLYGSRLVGLVCLEDVRRVLRERWDATRVNPIMTPAEQLDPVSLREEASDARTKLSCRRDILRWLHLQSESALR